MNFTISLTDNVSNVAKASASALGTLESAIKSESTALRNLENQMRSIQKASVVDISTASRLRAEIAKKKDSVAELTASMVRSGGMGFQSVKKPAEEAKKAIDNAGGAAKVTEKYLGQLGGKAGIAGDLLRSMGGSGLVAAAGVGATVVVVGALAGAIAYLGTKVIQLGTEASEAKGDVTRSLELLYGSQEAAEHTYKVIEGITSRVAMSQGRIVELTNSFTEAGQVNGDRLVRSIEAVGKAEAARKGAGQVIEGLITRATSTRMFSVSRAELIKVGLSYRDMAKEIAAQTGKGVSEVELQLRTGGVRAKTGIDALSAVIDSKMGKLAEKKFMTMGVQTQRLHDNFARLFEGADTGPIAKGLKIVADLLDTNSLFGRRMGQFMTKLFDDISKAIDVAKPYVETFFYTMGYLVLKAYNATKPLRDTLSNIFGGDQKKGVESFEDSMINFANNVAKGFAIAAVSIAYIIDKISTVDKFLDKVEEKSPAAGIGIQAAINPLGLLFRDWGGGGKDKPANDNAKQSGVAIADGVAQGIKQGTPAVDAAMAAMGDSAVKAFDAKMQIHSPSKVMAKRGDYLDQGVAEGVTDNASKVQGAMSSMGAGLPGSLGGASSGGSGVQVHFGAGAIVIHGNMSEAQQSTLRAQLTDMMADVFQQAALIQGAGAAA